MGILRNAIILRQRFQSGVRSGQRGDRARRTLPVFSSRQKYGAAKFIAPGESVIKRLYAYAATK